MSKRWLVLLWVVVAFLFANLFRLVLSVVIDSFGTTWFGGWLPDGFTRHWYADAWQEFNLSHVMVVTLSLLMWMPVCGPLPEVRLTPAGKMIYLFAQSIVPTVPAGWLTFADGVVYKAYDHGPRVFGLSVTDDQQLAGVIMKIGGSIFLWTLVTVLFSTISTPSSAKRRWIAPCSSVLRVQSET